jgi:hypothetical protein
MFEDVLLKVIDEYVASKYSASDGIYEGFRCFYLCGCLERGLTIYNKRFRSFEIWKGPENPGLNLAMQIRVFYASQIHLEKKIVLLLTPPIGAIIFY